MVPFLAVADMRASLAFYVDGLGFAVENKWIDDGVLRWCQLRLGAGAHFPNVDGDQAASG